MANPHIRRGQMSGIMFIVCALSLGVPAILAQGIFSSSANLMVQELKYDPYPVEAGKYVELWIKLDNYGADEAEWAVCELIPKYPFSLDASENATRVIGQLPGMESVILDYRIYVDPSAVEGANVMEIRCRNDDYSGWLTRKITLYVTSNVPEFAVGGVASVPSKLLPDTKDNRLTVELNNIGTGDAKLVTARLILPSGFEPTYSYSDIDNLGLVAEGATTDAVFYIDVDKSVEPGAHLGSIILQYKVSGGANTEYKNQILDVSLNVKATPLFVFESINTLPEKLSQGDRAAVMVSLKNIGSKTAESVSIKLYKKDEQPFTLDEKYDFIGDLAPGETGEAVFWITVDDDAAIKKHLLDGEIRYVVDDAVFVVREQIPLSVRNGVADSGTDTSLILTGLLCLTVIILYYGRRSKKRKK
ncbi:MAG: COG1361 S-layer family protein [Candidatus Aenigmatarchaeota archaeon]